MRRDEVVVDGEYYYCKASSWKDGLPGVEVLRIMITDAGMWVPITGPRWRPDARPWRRATGWGNQGYVLGVEVEEDGTLGREHLIWLKHLRGPWTEIKELVAENVRRREEQEYRAQVDQEERLAAANAAADLLRERGLTVHTDFSLPGYVKVRAEDVHELLNSRRAA